MLSISRRILSALFSRSEWKVWTPSARHVYDTRLNVIECVLGESSILHPPYVFTRGNRASSLRTKMEFFWTPLTRSLAKHDYYQPSGICFRSTRTWFKLETRTTGKWYRRALLTENPNEGEKKKKKRKSSMDNIVATRSGRNFSSAIDYRNVHEWKSFTRSVVQGLVKVWRKNNADKKKLLIESYHARYRLGFVNGNHRKVIPLNHSLFRNASQQSLQHKLLNILMHS